VLLYGLLYLCAIIKEQIMSANFFLAMPGLWSIILIVVVVLLLFGGKKIPELMRGLGGGIKEFKDASKEDDNKKEDSKNLNK
jgi:sec-independent protein translocase protein TatA